MANEFDSQPTADADTRELKRRTVLAIAGGTTATGLLPITSAQEEEEEPFETYQLGGETSGWVGLAPERIVDESNPPLMIVPGEEYEIEWENFDGEAHNFAILDAEGETVQSSELVSTQGETQTIDFVAEEDFAEYLCEPHPDTMRGEFQVVDDAELHTLSVSTVDEDGEPVEATVIANGQQEPTENGEVSMELPGGEYDIEVRAVGRPRVQGEVTLDGADEAVTATLETPGEPADAFELALADGEWRGADENNPTLEFDAGETYEITWTNELETDPGMPEQAMGNNLALLREDETVVLATEYLTSAGESQSIRFIAEEDLTGYMSLSQTDAYGEIEVRADETAEDEPEGEPNFEVDPEEEYDDENEERDE